MNQLLHAASRTFAVGIDQLREPLRTEIETAYLVLRVSDYLEDNGSMGSAQKVELLERWAAVLVGGDGAPRLAAELSSPPDETPDALVACHLARVHAALMRLRPAARGVIARHTADSSRGMARWVARGPDFPDEAALDDYMHEVAGRVGWLLTELFAQRLGPVADRMEPMKALGREFGLALQTVNVIRGLHSDWERGWIFVPRSYVPAGGPSLEALLAGSAHDPGLDREIVGRLADKADGHLRAAKRYVVGLPRSAHRIRVFCLLPYLFAVRTLAVSRAHPRVLREEAKITRAEVASITRLAGLFGWSDGWVRRYARHLARPPSPTTG